MLMSISFKVNCICHFLSTPVFFPKSQPIHLLTLLETYTSPAALLRTDKQEIIDTIKSTARFGLNPAVKQSGKFEGTKIQMFKRGSAIVRHVIHTLTLQSISTLCTGEAKNPVLRDYYLKKCKGKPKLVAIGAVLHKVCNMIFAILRDNKPFEIITPQ